MVKPSDKGDDVFRTRRATLEMMYFSPSLNSSQYMYMVVL
jgi:hypothetical protein